MPIPKGNKERVCHACEGLGTVEDGFYNGIHCVGCDGEGWILTLVEQVCPEIALELLLEEVGGQYIGLSHPGNQ